MSDDPWLAMARGEQCPMDAPRPPDTEHWNLVATLSISSLYLGANQTYRGHCQLVFDGRHATRLDELTPEEWAAFANDLHRACGAITSAVRPDHLNVESLGNVVPHLHWHIVPRYRGDGRWGAPIWTARADDMPDTRLGNADRQSLIQAIRATLEA